MAASKLIVVITRMEPRGAADEFNSEWVIDGAHTEHESHYYELNGQSVAHGLLLIHGNLMRFREHPVDLATEIEQAAKSAEENQKIEVPLDSEIWLFGHGRRWHRGVLSSYDALDVAAGKIVERSQLKVIAEYSGGGKSPALNFLHVLKENGAKRGFSSEQLRSLLHSVEEHCLNATALRMRILEDTRRLMFCMRLDAEVASRAAPNTDLLVESHDSLRKGYDLLCNLVRHPHILSLRPNRNQIEKESAAMRLFIVAGQPIADGGDGTLMNFQRAGAPAFECEALWRQLDGGDEISFSDIPQPSSALAGDFLHLSIAVDQLLEKSRRPHMEGPPL
jgi:hypothetical protein